jgi:hypothetical protein
VVVYYSYDNYRSNGMGQVRYVSYDLRTSRRTELPTDWRGTFEVSPPTRAPLGACGAVIPTTSSAARQTATAYAMGS